MSNVLVLLRHGQSVWNKKNVFTGLNDVDLTQQGMDQARSAGQLLLREGLKFDIAYTSDLIRAQNTLKLVLEELDQSDIETVRHKALNERDYGELAGLNKDEAREKFGDDKVYQWRRSYDIAPPGGESLKDTAERVLPYYDQKILPDILAKKNVIVSGHGNALRALVMRLEGMTPEQIIKYSIANGIPRIYQFCDEGKLTGKRDLAEGVAV